MNHVEVSRCGKQTLRLAADFKYLGDIRTAVGIVCRAYTHGPSEMSRAVAELELAATELVTNVIRHGYGERTDGRLSVQMSVTDGIFQLDLWHQGTPFDGNETNISNITEPQEHGMGLFLIQQCVDQIQYNTTADGESHIHFTRDLSRTLQEVVS